MAASRGKSKRVIRHQRVRQKISGTSGRPRFSVYRSLNNIYVQVIHDESGNTIASASSLEDEIRNRENSPLLKYALKSEQVIITPHIGGMCREAQEIAYGHEAKRLADYFEEKIQ